MPSTILEQAHREATRLPIPAIATKLQDTFGQRLTAYAVGIKDPKAIGKYARGEAHPREETARRLRELYQICDLLLRDEAAATARAWLVGSNPLLEDRAPVEELHEDAVRRVVRTATADAGPSGPSSFGPVIRAATAFAGVQ